KIQGFLFNFLLVLRRTLLGFCCTRQSTEVSVTVGERAYFDPFLVLNHEELRYERRTHITTEGEIKNKKSLVMKFMKLGSRPDAFYTENGVRSISSEVRSDLIIQVNETRYLLHKFPLLSKCLKLQRLCFESSESSQLQFIQLPDFPGGSETFELCAKFCYGITITIGAYNIVSARCAANYLQMTEDFEKGNLVHKLEVFFNSCILNGWKDCIITLQTTKRFQLWSEELGITSQCIEAMVSKVLSNPLKVSLSHNHLSQNGDKEDINGSKGWWGEDLSELRMDLYRRMMTALKSGGKVPANLIGDCLKIYTSKWLPKISKNLEMGDTIYDLDIVLNIMEQFMLQTQGQQHISLQKRLEMDANGDCDFQESCTSSSSGSNGRMIKVARLVDGYLQEIARDVNVALSKFIALIEASHPDLNKSERKHLCRSLNCKRLSMEACMHAAQNELLPLRVVVQVLFFEQARAATVDGHLTALPSHIKALLAAKGGTPSPSGATTLQPEDQWAKSRNPSVSSSRTKPPVEDDDDNDDGSSKVAEEMRSNSSCRNPNGG
ncbi:BTB/POZ fold, partial [Cynara cardunculus var. scolymus]